MKARFWPLLLGSVLLVSLSPVRVNAGHVTCQGETTTKDGTPDEDNDNITGGGQTIKGTNGKDVIAALGNPSGTNDLVFAYDGPDVICGNGGFDTLYGHAGADLINGGEGDDNLHGEGGGDSLWGGAANDEVFGSGGDDVLFDGMGSDIISGGDGYDVWYDCINDSGDFYPYGKGIESIVSTTGCG